jgi:hypothetical protein
VLYHPQISNSLCELGPELDRPIQPDELDERGCVEKAVLAEIDKRLKARMAAHLADFSPPAGLMTGTDPKNKWRVISCLQKSIRFGDVEMAAHMMNVAMDLDALHAIKRLGVIAVEDVGYGNLLMVMNTLAAIGDARWRLQVGGRKLMIWLAMGLAGGRKDRSACELGVAISLWENPLSIEMGHWANGALEAVIDDEAKDWRIRHAAIWNMGGTKRYGGHGVSETNDRPATYLFEKMVRAGMSMAGYYIAAKTCSRLQDSMWPALFLMDEWARHTPKVEVQTFDCPTTKVGSLLGAAYDRYVREGKIAIAKLFRETPQLQDFLLASPETRRDQMKLSGVFMAEGGTLNRMLVYGGSNWIRTQVRTDELRYHWLPPGLKGQFIGAVKQNLDALNDARSKVLYAVLKT